MSLQSSTVFKHYPSGLLLFFLTFLLSLNLNARDSVKPTEGLHEYTPRTHALINATVIPSPGERLDNARIIIRDGLIESVGTDIQIPADARVWDLSGKIVYPGFIDAYSHVGMPEGLKPFIRKPQAPGAPPQKAPPTPSMEGPTYWNKLVTPERNAATYFKAKKKESESLTNTGFTATATYPGRGIFRGQGALVHLNGKNINDASVKLDIAQHLTFEQAGRGAGYPSSMMGSIALSRQVFHDAIWHRDTIQAYSKNPDKLERPAASSALNALQGPIAQEQTVIFQAKDELDYQRIERLSTEFDLDFAILGNGYEYRRASVLKEIGKPVIIPLAFPKTPLVERADTALDISLAQLQHWELAPSNAAFLEKEDVSFCLSAHFLKDPGKEFWSGLRKAVKRGLSVDTALSAITINPAELYGVEDQLGSIEAGKIANLVVASGDLFSDENAKVDLVWIDGDPIKKKSWDAVELKGDWIFSWEGVKGIEKGSFKTTAGKVTLKTEKADYSGSIENRELLLFVPEEDLGLDGESKIARLRADIEGGELRGTGALSDGSEFSWNATLGETITKNEPGAGEQKEKKKEETIPELVFDSYPAGAYGVKKREIHPQILVRGATVWTSGAEGILENADVLIEDGKIVEVGRKLKKPKGALVINAKGKHVTPGLIDCHSHFGSSGGLNESASSNSTEVRVGDILNPVDINIYRQLAGGLTSSNILHGSANTMGGQNQVIKLGWGTDAEGLKLQGAKPGVKFALGENVKQSNWGEKFTTRYPQTRMGVEQYMESNFREAEDYERRWANYTASKTHTPPRRNLRMEATLEILRGERCVHIHSYRQDEVLAFARLAGRLNLDVAAFQHILEGYKVADALTEINAGGSSFSDWWAYKFEVYDAIPHNGAIMHEAGVIVSFNSDNAELATRLNTEAAKAVKYGGVSEEDALKFVTLNPAIQLRIEDRVGSLEPGKDADFVIWNTHPLSTYAYAEQTWIDGIRYFDREQNQAQFEADNAERERLVQKALQIRIKELKLGAKPKKPKASESAEEHNHDHGDPEKEPEWIYHSGTLHYSCSGNEEEGHVH